MAIWLIMWFKITHISPKAITNLPLLRLAKPPTPSSSSSYSLSFSLSLCAPKNHCRLIFQAETPLHHCRRHLQDSIVVRLLLYRSEVQIIEPPAVVTCSLVADGSLFPRRRWFPLSALPVVPAILLFISLVPSWLPKLPDASCKAVPARFCLVHRLGFSRASIAAYPPRSIPSAPLSSPATALVQRSPSPSNRLVYITKATKLYKEMAENGCKPNVITYRHLALGFLKAGLVNEALKTQELGKNLAASTRIRRSIPWLETTLSIVESFGKKSDIENAEKLFQELKYANYTRYTFVYNALMKAYVRAKIYEPNLLEQMILGVARPDSET